MIQHSNNRLRAVYFSGTAKLALIVMTLGTSSAYAQVAPPSAHDEAGLADIVVTARKRDERLQDVPISATIIGSKELVAKGATDLVDLSTSVPNLSFSSVSEGKSFVVRGITTRAVSAGLDDGLGVYVDGVLAGRPAAYNQELTRAERVEVLRGPQGTLFGKNTMSGAINIVTKKPSDNFAAFADASYGNLKAVKLAGSVEGPIGEGLAAAISGSFYRRDGYLINIVDGRDLQNENRLGGRVQLRYHGGPLEVNLSFDALRERKRGISGQLLTGDGAVDPFGFTNGIFLASFLRQSPRRTEIDGPSADDLDLKGANLTIDYDLGGGYALTSISGFRRTREHLEKDADATNLNVTDTYRDKLANQVSQELRIASPTGRALDFVAGAYFYHQKAAATSFVTLGPDFGLPPAFDRLLNNGYAKTNSYALFINGNYHISQQLVLNLGGRYTYEKKSALWNQTGVAFIGLPSFSTRDHITGRDFSPTVSLTYTPSRELTAYAKISRGYKSGGFNLDLVASPNISFGPENATAYEVGIKTQPNRWIRANVAGFYTDYKNIQTFQLTSNTGITTNAGAARLKGFEADFQVNPIPDVEIAGGAAYTDARYKKFDNCNTTGASCAGNRIFAAPDWTANGSVQYRAALGDRAGSLVMRGEVDYRGSAYFDATNVPVSRARPFTLLSARLTYAPPSDKWEISLWGKNLANKTYEVFRESFTLLGQHRVIYGEPRTYGIEARTTF